MAIMTNGQYARWKAATKAGDKDLVAQIEAEPYGHNPETIDVDVIETPVIDLPDAETIEDKLAAGMTKAEMGKEFGITHQKVSAILKAGGE